MAYLKRYWLLCKSFKHHSDLLVQKEIPIEYWINFMATVSGNLKGAKHRTTDHQWTCIFDVAFKTHPDQTNHFIWFKNLSWKRIGGVKCILYTYIIYIYLYWFLWIFFYISGLFYVIIPLHCETVYSCGCRENFSLGWSFAILSQ